MSEEMMHLDLNGSRTGPQHEVQNQKEAAAKGYMQTHERVLPFCFPPSRLFSVSPSLIQIFIR